MNFLRLPLRTFQRDIFRCLIATVLLVGAPSVSKAGSGFRGEFIPFPEVTIHYNDKDVPNLQQHGSTPLVDFFYTARYNDWRMLGELLVSDDERDLERLIFGKVYANGRQLWVGRNHSDLDQWNKLFHRETYLQTSIHRPGIIEFEDEGGVLSAHITGFTLEDDHDLGEHSLNYRLTMGLGPILEKQYLKPYDLLKLNQDSNNLALSGMVSKVSETEKFKESGLFVGYAIIPSTNNGISRNKQTVIGAYTNYSPKSDVVWRASAFYVFDDIDLPSGGNKNSSFAYAYIQPEYNLNTAWTVYGRVETNTGANNDLFVQQIPAFISERTLIGTRFQMENRQVIKLELATLHQFGQHFMTAEVQWSAALP